jgi:hypothetical protein
VLKKSLNIIEGIRAGVFDVIEESHVRMVQEHQEEGNESQPVKIGKENFFLLPGGKCRGGFRLHQ